MLTSYLVETPRGTPAARRLQIAILIDDLSRSVQILSADIEHEEGRAGVSKLSEPAYPVLARTLRTRRENIAATIASLEALLYPRQPE